MSNTDRALHGDHYIKEATRLLDQASNTPLKSVSPVLAGAQVHATLALVAAVRDVADQIDTLVRTIGSREQ